MSVRIHPTAMVEENVTLGNGTSVWDNAHIRCALWDVSVDAVNPWAVLTSCQRKLS